jgi:hypothetical protein
MKKQEYPKEFLEQLSAVTNKRARVVIDHILEHGYVTTEELEKIYGYNHPPRAARDVREQGIPLDTFKVTNNQGRKIAAYRFGELSGRRALSGRRLIPKKVKQQLMNYSGSKCYICLISFEANELQVDHRVPYEIAGDFEDPKNHFKEYMLLCGSCNRAKSWSCEHCHNWLDKKDSSTCLSCYWASPNLYKHIGLRKIRRIELVWIDQEVRKYDEIERRAKTKQKSTQDYIKNILIKSISD